MPKVHVSENSWGRKVWFWCPACKGHHAIDERHDGGRPSWGWNGDLERPTFTPSLHVTHWCICHSFVRDGQIEYLGDCTHAMPSQTVELPDWPGWDA
jgi:hypothetical protein